MSIDVILRAHEPSRLDELARSVFAAAMQEYGPATLLVVCQRFDPDAVTELHRMLAPILALSGETSLRVLNRIDAAPADARAPLLNMGLAASTSRYVAFLDHGDLIYAEGWRVLTTELARSGAAIAFGAVLNTIVNRDGLVPYVTAKHRAFQGRGLPQLLRGNFCPNHSFVLDRSRIAPEDLAVDESLVALQEYDLLLRLVSKYGSSFDHKDTLVGESLLNQDYNIPTAQSGATSGSLGASGSGTPLAALAEIERRKHRLVISPAVQAQLGVCRTGMTIAEYLACKDAPRSSAAG